MLYHVCSSEISASGHWIEFPLICKVHLESGESHYIIFAQIPPFCWAFPLPLERHDVPDTISDEMITSEIVVKGHYKEAMSVATQLSKDFELIVAGVNKELEACRKSDSLDPLIQKLHKDLEKEETLQNEGKKLENEKQDCKKTEKKIREIMVIIQKKKKETYDKLQKVYATQLKAMKKKRRTHV